MLIGSGSKVPLKRDSRAASASVLVIIPTAIWPNLDSAPTTKKGSSTPKREPHWTDPRFAPPTKTQSERGRGTDTVLLAGTSTDRAVPPLLPRRQLAVSRAASPLCLLWGALATSKATSSTAHSHTHSTLTRRGLVPDAATLAPPTSLPGREGTSSTYRIAKSVYRAL